MFPVAGPLYPPHGPTVKSALEAPLSTACRVLGVEARKEIPLFRWGPFLKVAFWLATLSGVGCAMDDPTLAGELAPDREGPRPSIPARGLTATSQPKNLTVPMAAARKAWPQEAYVRLPLSFEPNLGQAGEPVRFLSRGVDYSFLLLDSELVVQFQATGSRNESEPLNTPGQISALRMRLVDGKSAPRISGENQLGSRSHYLRSSDPSHWQVNVPNFSAVRYQEVYPGIDLIFYGNRQRLEFDFALDAGADPRSIELHFGGNGGEAARFALSLDDQGGLILPGGLRLSRPVAFQEKDGGRQEVAVAYELRGDREVGLHLGPYDRSRPLVIDPVLTYSASGIGGSAIAVDKEGNAYVTGVANPAFLASLDAFQSRHSEGTCYGGPNLVACPDILLAKLNASGTELIYSTFLGGSGFEYGYGVAVDAQGNAYLTGTTSSPDFPVSPDAWQSTLPSEHCSSSFQNPVCSSAFVTKVNSTGTDLLYSTFLGGERGGLGGNGVAVDAHGSAYVTGDRVDGGFVAKLHPGGTSLLYSIKGIGGTGIALDSRANAYLTGRIEDASYVTKLDPKGTQVLYNFRLGGSSFPYDALPQEVEAITGVAVDEQGHAYLTGYTAYPDFPTTPGSLSETAPGVGICGNSLCLDAFISKLNPEGTELVYSTYLGGSSIDFSNGVGVDSRGNAYVTGVTLSPDFPTTQSLGSPEGQIFVSKLNPEGTELVYSVRAGAGASFEGGIGLSVAPKGSVYITGRVGPDFPVTPGAYQTSEGNGAFVARLFDDYEVFVPIVLSASGLNNSFLSSELTLTNRGTNLATLDFTYKAAFGGGSGTARDSLPAGQQHIIPDAIHYLRQRGIPIPNSDSQGGTLVIRFSGLNSDLEGAVTVRTTTAVEGGRAGSAYPAVSTGFHRPTYLCGLRHNAEEHSNLAVQNMGGPARGEITLRLTVISGDPDNPGSFVLPDQMLLPGDFRQIGGVLRSYGLSLENGYVRIEKVQGAAPYYAYAFIDDQASSDGSFIAPVLESATVGRMGQTLPAIVDTASSNSELVVTNWSESRKILGFSVLSDGIQHPQVARFVSLRPREQLILPDFVNWLRQRDLPGFGLPGLGPPGQNFSGPLFVTSEGGDGSGLFVGARTSTRGAGNRYGFFYAATPYGDSHHSPVWVYGLRQDEENRTSLGIVNTGELSDETSLFRIEIYDGATGLLDPSVEEVTVEARQSIQIDSILGRLAPGIRQGYARISRVSGSNPFLAFAVVNDGAQPGQRTGDGAFIYGVP